MWCCWSLAILLWVSTATPALSQSGDGDGESGSGFGISMTILSSNASQEVGDEPIRTQNKVWVTSSTSLSQPSPSQPSPSQPSPSHPSPSQPSPSQPSPSQPSPSQTSPSQPLPSQPSQSQPLPSQRLPSQPSPSELSPSQPSPSKPSPSQPSPSQPSPSQPSQPQPSPSTFSPSKSPPAPILLYEPRPDECSVHFHTSRAGSRSLKDQRENLTFIKAIQHGNQAVMENLIQYVGAELGEQSYEDVIQENVVGIRDDHLSCDGLVKKVAEDLEGQLEGDVEEALAGMQKIKEESLAFEGMLRAAADIASRLEVSSQALHASFTRQLKDKHVVLHR